MGRNRDFAMHPAPARAVVWKQDANSPPLRETHPCPTLTTPSKSSPTHEARRSAPAADTPASSPPRHRTPPPATTTRTKRRAADERHPHRALRPPRPDRGRTPPGPRPVRSTHHRRPRMERPAPPTPRLRADRPPTRRARPRHRRRRPPPPCPRTTAAAPSPKSSSAKPTAACPPRCKAPPAASRTAPASYRPSTPGWTASPNPPRPPRSSPGEPPRFQGLHAHQCDAAVRIPRASHSSACRAWGRRRWPRTAKDPGPPMGPRGPARRSHRRGSPVVRCAVHPRDRPAFAVAAPVWFLHRGLVPVGQGADPSPAAVLARTDPGCTGRGRQVAI